MTVSTNSNNYSMLAIFFGQFGLGLMHTTFMFYYVKVFLNVFQVSEFWFNLAQLLFLIWNAINDPLFGYLQDMGGTWMKDRAKIFTYFGPFLVLSFLITWFPWRSETDSAPIVEGLHLIVSLFLYDAFFSCVGVAWSAFYSDSTRDHRRRVRGIKYAQLATLCSINVITFTEKISHSLENFGCFQIICLALGMMSLVCFYIAGQFGSASLSNANDGKQLLEENDTENEPTNIWSWTSIVELTKELVSAKDFQRVVFLNFVHILRSVSQVNFAVIAVDILVPQSTLPKGSWQLSAFFAVCTLLPQILVISNDKLLLRKGAYRVMCYGLFLSICSSSLYLFSASPCVILLFMVIDCITVQATSPLINILLSEVIEDDKARHTRRSPLSSLIFSLNALITKPAVSIAPVVIVYLLNRNGYEQFQKDKLRPEQLQQCMSRVLFAIPLLLGTLEFLVFRSYSLRHKHRTSALPI